MYKPIDFYITPNEYEIAFKNGISKSTVEQRIRRFGWNKEKAITKKPQQRHDRVYWRNIAAKNGISQSTFSARINRHGWDEKRAATTPVVKTKIRNRKYSDEVYKRLEENGISKELFYDRIRRGWNIERAITTKKFSNEEKVKSLINKNNYFKKMNDAHWKMRNIEVS